MLRICIFCEVYAIKYPQKMRIRRRRERYASYKENRSSSRYRFSMRINALRTIGCLSRLHLNKKLIDENYSFFDRDVVDKLYRKIYLSLRYTECIY